MASVKRKFIGLVLFLLLAIAAEGVAEFFMNRDPYLKQAERSLLESADVQTKLGSIRDVSLKKITVVNDAVSTKNLLEPGYRSYQFVVQGSARTAVVTIKASKEDGTGQHAFAVDSIDF